MRKQASIQDCFGSHSPFLLLPSVMNIAFSLWHSEAGWSKLISILLHFNERLCISVWFFSGPSSFTGHLRRWWNSNDLISPWNTSSLNLLFSLATYARMSCAKYTTWNKQRLQHKAGRAACGLWHAFIMAPNTSAGFTSGKTRLS